MKNLIYLSIFGIIILLISGCSSTPEHGQRRVPPGTQDYVSFYDTQNTYDTVPGVEYTENDVKNVVVPGKYEIEYHGRYQNPNDPTMLNHEGVVTVMTDSPHWNMRPNPTPMPYEVDAAYKHIKNIANATPLYAEMELKIKSTENLNETLKQQVQVMKENNALLIAQANNIDLYKKELSIAKKDNSSLENQINALQSKYEHLSKQVEQQKAKANNNTQLANSNTEEINKIPLSQVSAKDTNKTNPALNYKVNKSGGSVMNIKLGAK
ncbi:MAG TPA: hypothetical protein QF753_07130 [Victivallales bacterium]|nr:hypothetical protein [Victivallales bacterium]